MTNPGLERSGPSPHLTLPPTAESMETAVPAVPHEGPTLTPEQARLLPFYHDLRNEIVQPEKVVVSTQYFWSKWAPRLGPTLTALVICLRRHCYYNRVTQERRDWCFPEQATLAREVGVETTKTIRAALQHPLILYFVRREARYAYDPVRAKKVRTSDMYYVAMDDPLVPEDEILLAERAAERLVSEGRGAENLPQTPSVGSPRPKGQKDRQITRRQDGSSEGQKDRQVQRSAGQFARQDSAVILTPEDVLLKDTKTMTRETPDSFDVIVAAFGAANAVIPTPAQVARLQALCEQFDGPARQGQSPQSGAEWVLAAIREAVESGSHFVAPRRIARICERWAAAGGTSLVTPPAIVEPPAPPIRDRAPPAPVATAPVAESEPVYPFEETEPARSDGELPSAPAFIVFPELGLQSRPFWQTVCDEVGRRLGTSSDVALLAGSLLLAREGEVLTIGVSGRAVAERAELRLRRTLEDVSRSIVGRSVAFRFISFGTWTAADR